MNSFRRARRARRASAHERNPDTGFTLTEVLIAMTLSGILIAAISTALSVVLRTAPQAETRLAESKDVTFLQTWVPVDLATAINSYTAPSDAAVKAKLVANPPNVSYLATLPGTNVLTLVIPNPETGSIEIIAYRYVFENGVPKLIRFRITNPGVAGLESVSPVGVAYEIPKPPVGWVPGDPVDFAFEIIARNQAALRPVGEDVTVYFESGNEFRTGGAGLSAERTLTPNDPVTLADPTAPPSRCGGRISLVIDTSGSVPAGNGGVATQQAAVGFVNAFIGTPTYFSVNGFDRAGYGMINDTARPNRYVDGGNRAPYVSVLDTGPAVTTMINRINAIDNRDGNWNQSNADSPTVDGIHWDQIGSGTNWEDGLYTTFFDAAGQPYNSNQPDLVVFITDGQPNWIRGAGGTPASSTEANAVARARTVANSGRSLGARVIGVIVGNARNNVTYQNYLKQVVSGTRRDASNQEVPVPAVAWNGSVASDGTVTMGNAVAADFFSGSFNELGGVLRSIMAAQCGGTVTLRKQLTDGTTPAAGQWTYRTDVAQVLDVSKRTSITFDFPFETNQTTKTVFIEEADAPRGQSFVRGDCSVAGVPLPAGQVVQNPGGVAGVQVTLRPDQAVSCVMVSQYTP